MCFPSLRSIPFPATALWTHPDICPTLPFMLANFAFTQPYRDFDPRRELFYHAPFTLRSPVWDDGENPFRVVRRRVVSRPIVPRFAPKLQGIRAVLLYQGNTVSMLIPAKWHRLRRINRLRILPRWSDSPPAPMSGAEVVHATPGPTLSATLYFLFLFKNLEIILKILKVKLKK